MAKSKKLKFVSEEQVNEYKKADLDTLLSGLIRKSDQLNDAEDKKKKSQYLKELRDEIREYRKDWEANHEAEMEAAKQVMDSIKEERDEKIEDAITEKKELEGGFNDGINAMKEHVRVIIDCIKVTGA